MFGDYSFANVLNVSAWHRFGAHQQAKCFPRNGLSHSGSTLSLHCAYWANSSHTRSRSCSPCITNGLPQSDPRSTLIVPSGSTASPFKLKILRFAIMPSIAMYDHRGSTLTKSRSVAFSCAHGVWLHEAQWPHTCAVVPGNLTETDTRSRKHPG